MIKHVRRMVVCLLLGGCLILVVQCRARSTDALSSTTPERGTPSAGMDHTHSLTTTDGRIRTFMVHTPPGYNQDTRAAVVLVLHGGGGNSENIAHMSAMSEVADARGFIAVYPQGSTRERGLDLPTWNAGACCGFAAQAQVDDVASIRQVVSEVASAYSVDRTKVFVAGMSNGGMMAQRLACDAADLFAGAASVVGSLQVATCTPSRPIPMLLINGTADESIPYNGGLGDSTATQNITFPSVEENLHEWAVRNGCVGEPRTQPVPPLVDDGVTIDTFTYAQCSVPVILYRVNGGTHSWPGGRPAERRGAAAPTQALNASEIMWRFFADQGIPH